MLSFSQIKQKSAKFMAQTEAVFLAVFVPNKGNAFLPEALKQEHLFWYGASLLIVKIALISLTLALPSTSFFSAIAADRLVSLINQERQARNLSALSLNASLNSVAGLKVNDMLAKDYFDHTSPSGISPWYWFKQIGYNYALAGVNLAMGFTETDAVFQAWMNSPSHRDNILNPNFKEMGLAVKSGQIQSHADTLTVLVFGRQKTTTPKTPIAQNILSSNVSPKTSATPAPAAGNSTLDSQSGQIELKTILAVEPQTVSRGDSPAGQASITPTRLGYAPRVLGAFVSKSDEIFKSLYLYFTLFLAIALLVNIFVKIKIQCWPTIGATTLIIILSTTLIFI